MIIRAALTPRPYQRHAHALRALYRFLVLVWHRRAGKSWWALQELLEAAIAIDRPGPRPQFGYIAPELKQAKGIAWEPLKQLIAPLGGHATRNETELAVTVPNAAGGRSLIRLFGSDNPDAFRGWYWDGVVLDEAGKHKPEVWQTVLRPGLSDYRGWAVFIGTPEGENLLSDLYHGALAGTLGGGWATDLRRADQTKVIAEEELEAARLEMGDLRFEQEFLCNFSVAAENQLISLSLYLEAERRRVPAAAVATSPRILGVDVAAGGGDGDESVIAPRQGLVAFPMQAYRQLGLLEFASQVALAADEWQADAVFVDRGGGYGLALLEQGRRLGQQWIGVDFGGAPRAATFYNRGAEMWWAVREWLREGGALPQGDVRLQRDLTRRQYHHGNPQSRVQLETKKEMAKRGLGSPDRGDALALTFAAPVLPRSQRGVTYGTNPARRYSPFASTERR